ncbi:hypothetical protein QZH41_010042 [Actinostola sp. cb2023]|nr:hypothetical protein QZH41_010042 [Actinostola sp. cb2023]
MAIKSVLAFLLLPFFVFLVKADLLDTLNITIKKTPQYDELYTDATYAYNLKDYCKAMKSYEQALADYKHQNNVKLHCRQKCYMKFQDSLGQRHVQFLLADIELEYFRLTIYSRRCTQKCVQKYLGKRSHVSQIISDEFETRRVYQFLQFAYYKCGKIIKGAQATYTYLEKFPNDQSMLDNMKYYKSLAMVTDDLIFSLEPVPHVILYFKATKLYEVQDWPATITTFEETLKEYYKAYEECKYQCDDVREKNQILGKAGLFDVYVDVLRCRSECPAKLATLHGNVVDKYLPRHYNYLQMSYWHVEKIKEATECASSYLLLDPDDASMYDNLKIFRHHGNFNGTEVHARQDAILYHRSVNLASKLLHMAEMYTSDSDINDEWFEDPDDLLKPEQDDVQTTEDLIEGEEHDFSAIKMAGLGPLKDPSKIKEIDDVLKMGKYKGVKLVMDGEKLNGTNRFVADGFLEEKDCKILQDLAGKTAKLGDGYVDRSNPDEKPFSFTDKETFEGVTPLDASKAILGGKIDVEPVELYMNASETARAFVEDYFQMDTPLYFSYTHLVCRTALEGNNKSEKLELSHPIHSDNCLLHRDGPGTCPKRSPAYTWRDYSAILYLNKDFVGGEFIFAHRNETIQAAVKPRCGRLVGFSAGIENLHGVLGIKSGRRCAVALWFTMREKKDETARHEAMEVIKEAKEKIVGKDQLKHQFATTTSHVDL